MISIGNKAFFEKIITEQDVILFSTIIGDSNLIHTDEIFAQSLGFKGKIVHGLLTASLISTVIGTKLPGIGSIYLKQILNFIKPVFINDRIKACVEVINIEKNIVNLKTYCINQNSIIVLDGEATIKVPPSLLTGR